MGQMGHVGQRHRHSPISQAQLLLPRRLLLSPRSTCGLSSSETLSPLPEPSSEPPALPYRWHGRSDALFGTLQRRFSATVLGCAAQTEEAAQKGGGN